MSATKESGKIIFISLMGNLALAVAKFVCYLLSKSPSMLAETIHTSGDTFNQFLILIGNKQGQIGPCHRYPMGRGRAAYVFNLLASVGIFIGALYTIYHGIHALMNLGHHEKIELNIYSFVVLGLSIVIEGYVFSSAYRGIMKNKGEKSFFLYLKEADDPSIIGILFEDGIAIFGSLVAILGIAISYQTQSILPDAVTALIIGAMLILMAVFLFKLNYSLIVGAALPRREQEKIKKFILTNSFVDEILHMTTEVLAPGKVRLSVEVEFHGHHLGNQKNLRRTLEKIKKNDSKALADVRNSAIRTLGSAINELEEQITNQFPNIVVIDLEPY
ncbi:MAG: cation diffusion facilitator family transporter [Bacteriovoracaceae bacterium]|jgi:cation diffusion facilitator family transporter|nr:cation diffusion facilitator family transporter [Bacteriovoracaceae bacterium]